MLTLLHEGADGEPKAVHDGELVVRDIGVLVARMRILPFIRREARNHKQHKAHNFKNK